MLFRSDFASVIERVERAIACGAHGELLGRLRLRQAEAHRWQGDFVASEQRGLEALRMLETGSDPWLMGVGEMASVFGNLGSVDGVVDLGGAMLQVCRELPPPGSDGVLSALSRTSTSALLLSKVDLAEALHGELERLAEIGRAHV